VGYGSSGVKDGALTRAEIWAPLWRRAAGYREIQAFLREGRASLDGRPAQNGLEFAQAACGLGVDRGIKGFVRYNLLKRRGDSYIALPAGQFDAGYRAESDLARNLSAVVAEMDRRLKKDAPGEYESLRRQVDEAMYRMLLRSHEDTVADTAACVGRLQKWILSAGKAFPAREKLSRDWVVHLSGVAEARVAAAVAGIWQRDVGAFREHLDRENARFCWVGASLAERMSRVLERRIQIADAEGIRRNPLGSAYRAPLKDAAMFLEESLDDERIEDLLFAFTMVDWRGGEWIPSRSDDEIEIWPVYALLKHLFLTDLVEVPEGEEYLRGDLRVLAALRTGDIEGPAKMATRRLQNAGLLPVEVSYTGGFDAVRLAGALLIPVPYHAAMRRILKSRDKEK